MMENKHVMGHLAALFTVVIWGTTFISTKVLLVDFHPVEILFFRFVMGFLMLFLARPHRLKHVSVKRELTFMAAGLCGICLYYLLENIALTFTMVSNVGVLCHSVTENRKLRLFCDPCYAQNLFLRDPLYYTGPVFL